MKERIVSVIKVILILGVCIAGITFMYILEGNTNTPPQESNDSKDTVAHKPTFYDKSAKEGLKEALEFYNIQHSDVVYAQAILETGHFKSAGCLEYNNLFGLYDSANKRYYKFNHWTESIEAYKELIQSKYEPPNDYYRFLSRIHYAEDPGYIIKLKQIVRKRNDKRGYTEGDSISQGK